MSMGLKFRHNIEFELVNLGKIPTALSDFFSRSVCLSVRKMPGN